MDTKSRNIRYSSVFKLLAALICTAGLLSAAWGLTDIYHFPLAVQGREYKDSQEYANAAATLYGNVYTVALQYGSEDNIREGKFLESDDYYLSNTISLQMESDDTVSFLKSNYQSLLDEAEINGDTDRKVELENELAARIETEQDRLSVKLAEAGEEAIENELASFRSAGEALESQDSMYYYAVSAEGAVLTNADAAAGESALAALPGYISVHENELDSTLSRGYAYYRIIPKGCSIAIGMLPGPYAAAAAEYEAGRNAGIAGIARAGSGALAFLLGMAWLLYAAGRRRGCEGVHVGALDQVYLDIGLLAAAVVTAFCCAGLIYLFNMMNTYSMNRDVVAILAAALVVCVSATAMLYLTSAARRLKRGELFRHTLIYKILSWLVRAIGGALGAGPLAVKAALLFAGYALASSLALILFGFTAFQAYVPVAAVFFFLVFLAINAASLFWVLRKAVAIKDILDGIGRIRSGDTARRIQPAGGKPFTDLATGINSLSEGLGAAVEDRVRAERMKAELITNVSHDLKTPLTSIITYVDLLKAEGPASENAAGYIAILDAKSQRLKALTEDLFEAAKAASGSIKPSLARLDVGELLSQGMGEMEDRAKESGLDFRVSLPAEKLHVMADGRLLWRVMENLFSNVFKYALPHSRVYVDAARAGTAVRITVKNISACELNMPPEELTERFTRGDSSRGSEGSGLGLAIARSLIELQGGLFRIEIDGDLFKAVVEFDEDVSPAPPAPVSP